MTFTRASPASVLAFTLIVAAVIGAYVAATYVAARRAAGPAAARRATWRFVATAFAWLALFTAWVGSGLLQAKPLPFAPITLLAVNVVAVAFACSPAGGRLARHVPLPALVGFQGFRLPLELVLHVWAGQGTVPTAMTWTGSNFDIITGVVAIALAPFAGRPAVAWVANLTGIVLLVNVGRVALMTSPVPFGWPVQPKLMLVAYLPYAYIASVCVAGALAGHVILTRRLLLRRRGGDLNRTYW